MGAVDIAALRAWVGREESCSGLISCAPVAQLSATLDHPTTRACQGESLPPLWHWLYCPSLCASSDLGPDGHPRRGGFLPPVPLARRMWAGSRLEFFIPLRVGDELQRVSTVTDVTLKSGRSGQLVFVTVNHRIMIAAGLAVEEEQKLVYRDFEAVTGSSPPSQAAPAVAQWSRELAPDPVLLFRYSALTFNSHRIHYDRDYAREVEGYGNLVVQGPLTATLLLAMLESECPGVQLQGFEFRGLRPMLAGEAMTLQGRRDGAAVLLWALDARGDLALQARAVLR